jgi:hypothetical protein
MADTRTTGGLATCTRRDVRFQSHVTSHLTQNTLLHYKVQIIKDMSLKPSFLIVSHRCHANLIT